MVYYRENFTFQGSRDPEGSNISRGGPIFSRGSPNAANFIITHNTCDFPGGSGPSIPHPSGSAHV